MRLQGKVAIITGAARGIGRETALLFAAEGAKVVICDLLDEGEEVAEEIRSRGGEAIFYKLDVTDREAVKRMVDAVVERYGRIDILVNNAGITRDAQFLKMTEED